MAISAGMAIASTVTAGLAGTLITGTIIGHFLITTALGAALQALSPKPSLGASGYRTTATGSALDHQIIYGETQVAGARVFDATTGTNNRYLHRVLAYTGHEIDSYQKLYLNDGEVTGIDGSGNVTEVTYPDGSTSDRYDGLVRIKEYLGTDTQTADPDLVAEVTEWTTDCRLQGIAYLYVRLEYNQEVFPNGIPEIRAVIRGKKVYDPRTATTVWSDNPALCISDYLQAEYGLAEDSTVIDEDFVITAANICEQTSILGGDLYTCNGAFTTGATPYDIISAMTSSMGGLLWYAQGKWRMKAAAWETPFSETFTEDDLRGAVSVSTRHSRRDNFNTVKGTFRGEESAWQTTDFPEVTNTAFLDADNGEESVADLELPFTSRSTEARRLARIFLERNRQQISVQASFGMKAFKVQVGDNIKLSLARFGWTNKEFEVVSWSFGLTEDYQLMVNLSLRETAESIFDEVDDGEVYERDNTNLGDPFLVPTVTPSVAFGQGYDEWTDTDTNTHRTLFNDTVITFTTADADDINLISKVIVSRPVKGGVNDVLAEVPVLNGNCVFEYGDILTSFNYTPVNLLGVKGTTLAAIYAFSPSPVGPR